ncbi:MAG: tetratricopeptide repeat protein [Candidatus Schekmanbacteria bacterium]|nr:tetratricopeptide repeat protein [Candidatus Schekmanbacteria bacterium]
MIDDREWLDDAPEQLGAYRLAEVVGEGGMGRVYRAFRVGDASPAAIKMLRAPNKAIEATIRREIHALQRLAHPGIVRIFDSGSYRGAPWFAMDLIEGENLRDWVQARWDPRHANLSDELTATAPAVTRSAREVETGVAEGFIPQARSRLRPRASLTALRDVLTLFAGLCESLAYLHGEGVVHRDLKPGNVLVSPHGRPIIVDFGISMGFGGADNREELTVDLQPRGTIAYMAPEQIRGELLDARADLYALGCMLYEAATGSLPFRGNFPALLAAHLRKEPLLPSAIVPALPAELDGLIGNLLAKDPRQRLGYARDVARVLEALGARWRPSANAPRARSYLYRARFHGREAELEELLRSARRVAERDGAGQVVLLRGESGIGKTRLLQELVRKVSPRMIVLGDRTRAPHAGMASAEEPGGLPLQPLEHLFEHVAQLCEQLGSEGTARLLQDSGPLLSAYAPPLRLLPGIDPLAPIVPLPPEASRLRLFFALRQLLGAVAREGPIVLILDDAQWLDELTAGFLVFLADSSGGDYPATMVLAAYRSEEETAHLRRVRQTSGLRAISLRGLSVREFGLVAIDMLALDEEPEKFVRFLEEVAEGNPFFAAEYLRAAVDEGVLYRDALGRWRLAAGPGTAADPTYASLRLPHGLKDLLQRRIARFSAAVRAVLEMAAVVGPTVELSLLSALAGAEHADLYGALDSLITGAVLEETAIAGTLSFVHDKLREAACVEIPDERRRVLHLRVAVQLRDRGDGETVDWGQLARHWDQGEARAEAVAAYQKAAERARDAAAVKEATQYCTRALALCSDEDRSAEARILQLRGTILDFAGDSAAAVTDLDAAARLFAVTRDTPARSACLLLMAAAQLRQGAFQDVLETLRGDGPDGVGPTVPASEVEASHIVLIGAAQWRLGNVIAAENNLRRAIDSARRSGAEKALANGLQYLVLMLHEQGRMEEGRAPSEELLALVARLGEPRECARALSNAAVLHIRLGRFDTARALLERSLDILRSIGDRPGVAMTLGNLGGLHLETGDLEKALQALEQAAEASRTIGDRPGMLRHLLNKCNILRDLGKLGEALEGVRRVVQEHLDTRNERDLPLSLYLRGAVLADCGAFLEARRDLQEAAAAYAGFDARYGEAECAEKLGEIAHFRGDAEEARRLWKQALDLARRTGYRSVELVARGRLCAGRAASGEACEPEMVALDAAARSEDEDTILEVCIVLGEAALAAVTPPGAMARQALKFGDAALELCIHRHNSRYLYRVEWLRCSALHLLGQPLAAMQAARAAAGHLAALEHGVPEELRDSFRQHPRVAPILESIARLRL